MWIGVTVPPQATLEETLAGFELAEELGLDSAWFSQPPGGLDALTVLALAAGRTRSVRLGTAAIPTFPAHPLVTARAARTADAAAPGRVVLGVSSGHRAWIEQEYGLRFERPVRQVTAWVRTVRRLLRGEALTAADNAFGLSVAGADTAAEIPVVVAATGPRLLEAAAGVADGVLTWMSDETYLGEIVLPAVTRGEDRSRRMADRRVPHDPAGCLRSGEVAAAAGVNVQTLHYYERLGLLAQAGRTAAGHRQYPARTVTLVRMIKNAQRLGFSLDEVARLIAAGADPDEIAAIAARKLTEIDAQIARLTAIRDALALAASVADHDREQLTQTKPHRLETP